MSTLYASPIRDAIKEAVKTAWAVEKVHYGAAMLPQSAMPYASVRLGSVPMDYVTVTDVEQTYRFEIIYVGKWGPEDVVEELKVDRANELIPELMTAPLFADYGMMPRVAEVLFDESDDPNEPVYLVQINFTVVAHTRAIA